MGVKVIGQNKILNKLNNISSVIEKNSAKVLQDYGNKMVKYARSNHEFQTRTGNLERAITAIVDIQTLRMSFFIDADRVTNNGYNYGVVQHDGFGNGYKKSQFTAPNLNNKFSGEGLQHDHFMVKAAEKYKDALQKSLRDVVFNAFRGKK